MIELKIKQNTQNWRDELRGFITASEVSNIMGCGYSDIHQLATQKITGITPKIDDNTQALFNRGHELEVLARPKVEELIGQELFPTIACDDDKLLSASFDGITLENNIVWEHKTYNKQKHNDLENGKIPEKDYWQIIQQMYISDCEYLIYTLSNENNFVSYQIARNDVPMCEDDFYKTVKTIYISVDDEVKKLKQEVYNFINNIENLQTIKATGLTKSAFDKYLEQKQLVDEETARLDNLKQELIKNVENKGYSCIENNGVKLKKISRKGRVNYSKFIKDCGLKVSDEYMGKDSEYWSVR